MYITAFIEFGSWYCKRELIEGLANFGYSYRKLEIKILNYKTPNHISFNYIFLFLLVRRYEMFHRLFFSYSNFLQLFQLLWALERPCSDNL